MYIKHWLNQLNYQPESMNLILENQMRKIVVLLLLIINQIFLVSGQMKMPADINRILEKATSGKEITEEENARLEEWGKTMEQFYENPESQNELDVMQNETPAIRVNNQCPEKTELSFEQLSREQYVELAQSLMKTYGSKTGDLQKLKLQLEKSENLTDGADMGAAFVMTGAGSASIYSIAWSAAQSPDDILTASNLGVALKDMGEYSKAVQVLLYANQLKPKIGLILCNLGWAYREAGDNANATIMFEKALSAAPKMSSPYLGLGLIAQCENNHLKSEQYLRKALTQKYSSVGFAVMNQAQSAKSPSEQRGSQPRPLTDEKGDSEGLYIPELPAFEGIGRMASQKQPVLRSIAQLEVRKTKLLSELLSLTERMKSMQTHTVKDTDNSVVFSVILRERSCSWKIYLSSCLEITATMGQLSNREPY